MPSLLEIAKLIANISNILLEPLIDVPRLIRKFKMHRDKAILPLLRIFRRDNELIELQQKLNEG